MAETTFALSAYLEAMVLMIAFVRATALVSVCQVG